MPNKKEMTTQSQAKILSFPHMAEASIIAKAFFETLGCKVIVPPYNNKKALEKGVINSPEFVCIPYKITLGNMIDALDLGVNVLIMLGGQKQGICRLAQYPINQEKTLKDLGYKFKMYTLGSLAKITMTNDLKELCGNPSNYYFKLMRAGLILWQKAVLIDYLNYLTRFYRAYELKTGTADKTRKQMLSLVDNSKTRTDLKKIKKTIKNSFENIAIEPKKQVVKIGLGGEFFCVMDYYINCDLERRLGQLGVLVENPTTYGYLLKAAAKLGPRRKMIKLGLKHVPLSSGGEDLPTIGRVEYFAKKGFDGYISLYPMGCMPETTVAPIVERLGKKFGLAVIDFSIDENLSETYLQTRLEAFVNTIKRKKCISA